jgi:4'-phosphopantetheinyl transferase
VKLYIAKINQDLQTRKVSKKLLATVNNYLNPQARIQKIASHLLLTHVLRIHHVSNSGISVNEYGKPFLKNQSLYFNLSHSDNYVICAVSKFSVGADIEKINQRIKSISQAFLSVSEQKMYHRSSAAKLTQI